MKDRLVRGKKVILTVVLNVKKKGVMSFSPAWMDTDPDAGNAKSIRIWKPVNNGFKLQEGEEYRAVILKWDSSKKEKTADNRFYLFVDVKIIGRVEELISEDFCPDRGVYIRELQSGERLFTEEKSATLVETRYRLTDKRHIILVKEVKLNDGGQVVLKKTEKILRKDLVAAIAEQLHSNEEAAKKLIEMLPIMDANEFISKVIVKPVEVIEVEIPKSSEQAEGVSAPAPAPAPGN
jgi:hypothetical protein